MKRSRRVGIVVSLCALLGAAPARADFAPDLTVALGPASPATAPALTATMTQPARDSAIERFTLNLPPGFVAAGAPGAASCAPAAALAYACPAASRIGTVEGLVGTTLGLSGAIHKLSGGRFVVALSTFGGAVAQLAPGSLTGRADRSLDLKLDQLPALPLTRLTFRFDGGDRSLVRTPTACGEYPVDGKFTSRLGEFALDRSSVAITGCRGVPKVQVANIRLSHRRFRAGGSRTGARTIIAWWAARPTERTDVRIERRKRGRWRRVGVLVAGGAVGDNVLRWDGRLRDRKLRPGRYALRIKPAGSAPSKRARFRILRPRR